MPVYLKKAKERPAEDLSQVRETVRQIIENIIKVEKIAQFMLK